MATLPTSAQIIVPQGTSGGGGGSSSGGGAAGYDPTGGDTGGGDSFVYVGGPPPPLTRDVVLAALTTQIVLDASFATPSGAGGAPQPTGAYVNGTLVNTFAAGAPNVSAVNTFTTWSGFGDYEFVFKITFGGANSGNFVGRLFAFYSGLALYATITASGALSLTPAGTSQSIGLSSNAMWVKFRVVGGQALLFGIASNATVQPTLGWVQIAIPYDVGLANKSEPATFGFQATNETGGALALADTITFSNFSRVDPIL